MYSVVVKIVEVFLFIGAVDLLCGNKLGLGVEFEKGFVTGGKLLLLMTGYICLSPVISGSIAPVIAPAFRCIGADPSMFAGIFLSSDAGGVPLAMQLCDSKDAGAFAGWLVGSVMGPTITFTIPVSIASVSAERNEQLIVIRGLLAGIITAPLGMLLGGLAAGFRFAMLVANLVPIIAASLILALLLACLKEKLTFAFVFLGKITLGIAYLGAAVAAVQKLGNVVIVPGMLPIDKAFPVVCGIALFLGGAFPAMAMVRILLTRPLKRLLQKSGLRDISVLAIFYTLVNSIATFDSLKEMDDRGKTINVAFAVAGAWTFGDHLGFTSQTNPPLVAAMVIAKLVAAVAAVCLALLMDQGGGRGALFSHIGSVKKYV